jgi:uncharacterized protein
VTTTTPSIRDRIAALDWAAMTRDLDSFGCTIVESVLTREECRSLAAMYERDDIFRSTIVMARHGFGRGEYKYWSYPLPEIVAGLRTALYPPLAAVANRWNQSMKIDVRYPETHEQYLERCHAAGQTRPTLSSAKNRIPRFWPKPEGICGMIATSCLLPASYFS